MRTRRTGIGPGTTCVQLSRTPVRFQGPRAAPRRRSGSLGDGERRGHPRGGMARDRAVEDVLPRRQIDLARVRTAGGGRELEAVELRVPDRERVTAVPRV